MRRKNLVFTSKTGTGTSMEVYARKLFIGNMIEQPVLAKFIMTIGSTPTITMKLQGLRLTDNTWVDLGTSTQTVAGTYYIKSDVLKGCHRYRLNITANTNVTVTFAWIGVGMVQD